jgi:DNA-directed RNA polymerase subunit E"
MKKVCKNCKLFVTTDSCPICKKNQFSNSWKGRIIILDHERSKIAKRVNADANGEYAIKVR